MTTKTAIRNINREAQHAEDLGAELADSVERAGQVLQFSLPDHEEGVDRLADIHRAGIAERTRRVAETKKALRKTIAANNAEIKRLKAANVEAEEGAARKIKAEEKIIAASRAFLTAVEAE